MGKIYLVLLLLLFVLLALPSTRTKITGLTGRFDRDARRQAAETARVQAQRAGEAARSAAGTARDAAGAATGVARGTADAVRGAGESVASAITDRRLRTLGRTLVIAAAPPTVGPILTDAVARTAVVDPVTAAVGEHLAWVYSSLGDVRFAAEPGPVISPETASATTVFGVVAFDYALGEPQGVTAVDEVLDRVTSTLSEHGVTWAETTRTFDPGPDTTADGPRRVRPDRTA